MLVTHQNFSVGDKVVLKDIKKYGDFNSGNAGNMYANINNNIIPYDKIAYFKITRGLSKEDYNWDDDTYIIFIKAFNIHDEILYLDKIFEDNEFGVYVSTVPRQSDLEFYITYNLENIINNLDILENKFNENYTKN